ncbi:MAG TPA: (Fe-S)-binding protein [Terrimicrobiaceae bacterium]
MSVEPQTPKVIPALKAHSPIRELDYALLQQCIHCGMCLPTCPTYDATKIERNSPRGRIALMRAIADHRLEPSRIFGEEMYFCLGCLACETACPAGVKYAQLFEAAREEAETAGVLQNPVRDVIRSLVLRGLFTRPRLLRFAGRLLWLYRATGAQKLLRTLRLNKFLPYRYRELERMTPAAKARFSGQLIKAVELPKGPIAHRVVVLTGCVQDIAFSDINRDTVDVLLANGCEVHTPRLQYCCGSLHAHNGETDAAKKLARLQIDAFELDRIDAIITNAAGCGSHLKSYGILLADDPRYAARAREWSAKVRDVHEWLSEIGFRTPRIERQAETKRLVTYHEACHLCHGQKITRQPREILNGIPSIDLIELTESTWCCGSAGIYNITQPEMAAKLQERKVRHIVESGASIVATANPGCLLQLESGLRKFSQRIAVRHPISLLAEAYRSEE